VGAFVSDFRALLDRFEARLPKPWINLSHSMGGALTTMALLDGERRFAGSLLSAPMFGLNTGRFPTFIARRVTWFAARYGFAGALVPIGEAPGVRLTHDEARERLWRSQYEAYPDLQLGGFTWGWLDAAFHTVGRLGRDRRLKDIDHPVVVLAAEFEDLVSNQASAAVAGRIPKGRFLEVEGAFHELLMETNPIRERVWAEFDVLADQVTPRPA
jgi:lysophospholipase